MRIGKPPRSTDDLSCVTQLGKSYCRQELQIRLPYACAQACDSSCNRTSSGQVNCVSKWAGVSECRSRTAVAPLERLKILMQVQGNQKVYTGVWQVHRLLTLCGTRFRGATASIGLGADLATCRDLCSWGGRKAFEACSKATGPIAFASSPTLQSNS